MSTLTERSAAVARDLLQHRAGDSLELAELLAEHATILRLVTAEAFARGYLVGLERALTNVRIEIEVAQAELDVAENNR